MVPDGAAWQPGGMLDELHMEFVHGASVTARQENRQQWRTRRDFLVAAVSSVVGIANLWRFPSLCYQYGGGMFLVPYLLLTLVIGQPIMLMELSLGLQFRAGDIEAFGGIHRRLRGIGISTMLAAAVAASYYVTILAWSVVYLVSSFVSPLPWTAEAQGLEMPACPAPGADQSIVFEAEERYLNDIVLHLAPIQQLQDARSYIMSGWVYGGLMVVIVCCYFALQKGVVSLTRAVYFTFIMPLLLLVILFSYNISLPGAIDGVRQYIGVWNPDALRDPNIWAAAAGQVFFTLSIGVGVMTAYGSYSPADTDLVADHMIITLTNTVVSIFAGLVVYAILGNVVYEEQQRCPNSSVDLQSVYSSSGIGLVFIVYPRGVSNFPRIISNTMGVLFFFTFTLFGMDSLFSVYEGFITVVRDTTRYRHESTSTVTAVVLGVTFIAATLFCTDIGSYLFSCMDHYLVNYGFLMIGVLEANATGWVYGQQDCIERVGRTATFVYTAGYHGAYLTGIALCAGLGFRYQSYENLAIGAATGVAIFVACSLLAFALRGEKRITFVNFFRSVMCCGTEILREELHSRWLPMPWMWDLMIKYICPPVLLGLIVSVAIADIGTSGYLMSTDPPQPFPLWLQIVCIAMLFFVWLAFFINIFLPAAWEAAAGLVVLRASRNPSVLTANARGLQQHMNNMDHLEQLEQQAVRGMPSCADWGHAAGGEGNNAAARPSGGSPPRSNPGLASMRHRAQFPAEEADAQI
eukprot:jgi/Tetstr1/457667/TSEL_004248.t1